MTVRGGQAMKKLFNLSSRRGKGSAAYEGRCGNCHRHIGDDEYCRYCGTKRGEGEFLPFEDIVQCVYGPPPIPRTHRCKSCGFEWTTHVMIDRQRYCPKCGGSAAAAVDEGGNGLLKWKEPAPAAVNEGKENEEDD